MDFNDLLEKFKWINFEEYIKEERGKLEKNVDLLVKARRKFREKVLSIDDIGDRLFQVDERYFKQAVEALRIGEVAGIDGTISFYPTPLGYWCRIGVVAVNYMGERLNKIVYISDAQLVDTALDNIGEFLKNIEELNRYTPLLYRALMFYKEREIALSRKEKWKIVHGPLIPLEMRLGRLGVEGVLETNLKLAERIVENERIIGVLSSTRRLRILNLGYVLENGEYLKISDLGSLLKSEIRRAPEEERALINDFIEEYGEKVLVGIYKAFNKAYVFEASRKFFREAAHILYADSLNNPAKGFPMLIDYADSLCKTLVNPEDFKRRLEYELLKKEGYRAFQALDERRLRWSR